MYNNLSPVLKPWPDEVKVVVLLEIPEEVSIVFEFVLTKTPIGFEFSSSCMWKWVESLPDGVVIDEPVIVEEIFVSSIPKVDALVSLVALFGKENWD